MDTESAELVARLTPREPPRPSRRISHIEYESRMRRAEADIASLLDTLKANYWPEITSLLRATRNAISLLYKARKLGAVYDYLVRLSSLCAEVHSLPYRLDNRIDYYDYEF